MRTTMGHMIANDESDKIHLVNDNVAVAWAGSVSANQMLLKYLKSELKLKAIKSGREATLKETANLLRNWIYQMIRRPTILEDMSSFLMAGTDQHGLHLFNLGPDGTLMEPKKFVSAGSGSVFVYGFLERNYKEHLSRQEGIDLAFEAVDVAMQRDIASGNGVNVFVIDKDGAKKVASKRVNTHPQ